MDMTYIPFAIRLAISRMPDSNWEGKAFLQAALEAEEAIFEDSGSQYNMAPRSVAPDKTAVARPHGVRYDIPTSLKYAEMLYKKENMEGAQQWLEYAKGLANAMSNTSAKNSYLNQIKTVEDSFSKAKGTPQTAKPSNPPIKDRTSSSAASSRSNANPPQRPNPTACNKEDLIRRLQSHHPTHDFTNYTHAQLFATYEKYIKPIDEAKGNPVCVKQGLGEKVAEAGGNAARWVAEKKKQVQDWTKGTPQGEPPSPQSQNQQTVKPSSPQMSSAIKDRTSSSTVSSSASTSASLSASSSTSPPASPSASSAAVSSSSAQKPNEPEKPSSLRKLIGKTRCYINASSSLDGTQTEKERQKCDLKWR